MSTLLHFEPLLSVADAAHLLHIHPSTLLRWAREGRVPHKRLSARKIVFPVGQLRAWIEADYNNLAVRAA